MATEIVTKTITIVGTGIEIPEIGTMIVETRRRMTIVVASQGLHLQSQRVMVPACLPFALICML